MIVDPIPAASILVHQKDGRVLTGDRRADLSFLAGFTVFPGGRIDASDEQLAHRMFGASNSDDVAAAAAIRELREETGLILDRSRLRIARATEPFPKIDRARLTAAPRWVTPEAVPIRFDTAFFCLEVASAEEPETDGAELSRASWMKPSEVLLRWERLEALLATPTLAVLRAVAEGLDDAAGRIARFLAPHKRRGPVMESVAGIKQLPLRTPTLPPAEHTNAYLIGREKFVVVDPATYDDAERDKLLFEIEQLEERGAKFEAVVLTHHHGDHIGSASWLANLRSVPVWAHVITRDLVSGRVHVTRCLNDGDVLELGKDGAGKSFDLQVLFTPGHAPGHIVLRDLRPGSGALIAGDMVAAIGTIIIDPPEGNMAEYLRQLERLRDLEPRVVFPAHGPGVLDGRAKFQQYINHRLMREMKVLAALAKVDSGTPESLLPDAYDDTPRELYMLAERSCLAHLLKLEEDGKASRRDDRFVLMR